MMPGGTVAGSGVQLRALATTLLRQRGLIFAVTLGGTLLVALLSLAIRPSYTAVAEIVVSAPGAGTGAAKPNAPGPDESAIDTEIAMLTSDAQLCRFVSAVSKQPELAAAVPVPPGAGLAESVRNGLKSGISWLQGLFPRSAAAAVDECGRSQGEQTPTFRELKSGLKIFQQRKSLVIAVTYTGKDPVLAAAIVNAIAKEHVGSQQEKRREEATRVALWFEQQLAAAVAARDEADAAALGFRLRNASDTVSADDVKPLMEAKRQLASLQAQYVKQRSLLERVRAMDAQGAALEAVAAALGVPADGQGAGSDLAENVQQALAQLTNDVEFRARQTEAVRAQVDLIEQGLSSRDQGQSSLQALEKRAASLSRVVDELQRRRDDSVQERDLAISQASVFTVARVPLRPSSIPSGLLILPGMAGFFLLGAALALTRERMDITFRDAHELAEVLGVACLGVIPDVRPRNGGAGFPDMRPSYHRAIRSVLVSVLRLARAQQEASVVLVTSSVPNEGKSLLALSLAMCAARIDRRVLLVDLSNGGPATFDSRLLASPIFDNAVSDAQAPDQTIRPIAELGYDYLSGADIKTDLMRFLISPKGRMLFARMRDRYDCIIIDGPPVLASAETRILASLADEVLFAVRWGETRRDVARNALNLLSEAGAVGDASGPRLSSVLTCADLSAHARYRYGDAAELLLTYDRSDPARHRVQSGPMRPPRPRPRLPARLAARLATMLFGRERRVRANTVASGARFSPDVTRPG